MSIQINNLHIKETNKTHDIIIPNGLNWLKGDNGSGKSILLDAISGMNKPKSCSINMPESFVYLNQTVYFSDRLKVKDFVKFVYLLNGCSQWNRDFKSFLEKYNISLDSVWNKTTGIISGGERQFLYVITILSIERDWYILDEPFVAIDEKRKKVIFEILYDKEKKGKSCLLTSHENFENNEGLWKIIYI